MALTDLPRHPAAGDPAPSFIQRTPVTPRFSFDSAAGRYLVLCFLGSGSDPRAQTVFETALARRDLFDDERACFFAVTQDPQDETLGVIGNRPPGVRVFWDFDLSVARRYGAIDAEAGPFGGWQAVARCWVVIDPTMRVIDRIAFRDDGSDTAEVMALLEALPPPDMHAGFAVPAPVLVLPRVFEPELCRHLIALYDAQGGVESGFMRQIDGRTVGVMDAGFKVRRDITLSDASLIAAIQTRFIRRVVPEIAKVHQFHVTRMERYIVSCYAAEDGGHFSAHRDNTTAGTAHRRFAVSVNLNADFEGGEVSFPEYGPRGFKAPPGGAVVFSCSLLHRVSRVTQGRRYAFLPFLYDDAAARIRERNAGLVDASGATAAFDARQSPAGADAK
ncbi:2OG-Fe(II) oxygenase family protein [Roseicyclus mahoneyensis]|uniref:Putative 2-oxoglutarate/Fe(II)-dependent dioxygenase YbiX n=1 Tax=Roseicyclus mahoneyensis TaxID=164332 RepID=A0A316GX06_9RHOB|nr:2OG-Fe(II) oxygenase [Roseicyclus mahoneyensis]PWK59609.1 putative 2-oxoglutarate/Fe(II)-dependent dioxygenase YbiX [Roseicyclus mahoneyensis]